MPKVPDPGLMPGLHDSAIPLHGYDDQGRISGVKQVTIGSLKLLRSRTCFDAPASSEFCKSSRKIPTEKGQFCRMERNEPIALVLCSQFSSMTKVVAVVEKDDCKDALSIPIWRPRSTSQLLIRFKSVELCHCQTLDSYTNQVLRKVCFGVRVKECAEAVFPPWSPPDNKDEFLSNKTKRQLEGLQSLTELLSHRHRQLHIVSDPSKITAAENINLLLTRFEYSFLKLLLQIYY